MTSIPNNTLQLAVDSSALVAIIDARDKFHSQANQLVVLARQQRIGLIYFDCVVIETIGAICRRTHEQKRTEMLHPLLDALNRWIPASNITWTGSDLPQLYPIAIDLVRQMNGALNFNDAFIAILCRELQINAILSFDRDFDLVPWLKRIADPQDL
jgi:predicted nucleic acid-binding protein